jgi:DNA repair protein RecN (Recombination protein N)
VLKTLRIENYALINSQTITFGPGLVTLTGETGAGKSVIINALGLCLGNRADKENIRHGTDKAIAEAEFVVPRKIMRGTSCCGKGTGNKDLTITLRRELLSSGTSRAFLNDTLTNLTEIKEVAARITDFHSQQGHRRLFAPEQHRDFLDSFAGINEDVERLESLYEAWRQAQKQLARAQGDATALRERLEFLHFQIDELSRARIESGEEERLEQEKRKLESVRTLMETGQTVVQAVRERDDAIVSVLGLLEKMLIQSAEIDPDLREQQQLLAESRINLNELCHNIEGYMSRLADDPERLEMINARLAELYRLKKKYGCDETELIEKLDSLSEEAGGVDTVDDLLVALEKKVRTAADAYGRLACEVSAARRKEAPALEKLVEKELAELAMPGAKFAIDFQIDSDPEGFDCDGETVAPFPFGLERIEFLISTNPKEPLKPVVKIASGGEMSRIMLALLSAIAGKYNLPTVVFDEIDTGIGGKTAEKLSDSLKRLAGRHQIIVISHLPPVAAKADLHLAVDKRKIKGRNIIEVRQVAGAERRKEMARMSGSVNSG